MTTLSEIRELESRLHSHFLEWSDAPLQNELLFFLDELQELHNDLDKREIPNTNPDGQVLNLRQRVALLASKLLPLDFYDQAQAAKLKQSRLF